MANGNRVTPPINSKGLFEVETPFRLNPKAVYEVIAIREMADLWAEHADIYGAYYEPYGLERSVYERDVTAGAAIISIVGYDGVHYIPDTFIVSYPELGIADYEHVVLAVSLGPIHKQMNLDALMKDIAQLCSRHLGIEAKVTAATAPLTNVLTTEEAAEVERIRKGLVEVPVSDYNKWQSEKQKRVAMTQANNARLLKLKAK